jgi:alpha-acetolactate decarboxylase
MNEVFQYSTASSLMAGVAARGLSTPELLSRGNHGLGTFRSMNGEMIVMDGEMYRMKDGAVVEPINADNDDEVHPFAMVTPFQATHTLRAHLPSKNSLLDILGNLLPGTKNHFIAVRIYGAYKSITVRTGNGQKEPHESLTEVGKRQVVTVLEGVRGTLIGFVSPNFLQGITVAGEHLHFITDDKQRGGHLLGLETEGEADISAAVMTTMHLELPKDDEDFKAANLVLNDHTALKAVEG